MPRGARCRAASLSTPERRRAACPASPAAAEALVGHDQPSWPAPGLRLVDPVHPGPAADDTRPGPGPGRRRTAAARSVRSRARARMLIRAPVPRIWPARTSSGRAHASRATAYSCERRSIARYAAVRSSCSSRTGPRPPPGPRRSGRPPRSGRRRGPRGESAASGRPRLPGGRSPRRVQSVSRPERAQWNPMLVPVASIRGSISRPRSRRRDEPASHRASRRDPRRCGR